MRNAEVADGDIEAEADAASRDDDVEDDGDDGFRRKKAKRPRKS